MKTWKNCLQKLLLISPELPIWPEIENPYRKLNWGTLCYIYLVDSRISLEKFFPISTCKVWNFQNWDSYTKATFAGLFDTTTFFKFKIESFQFQISQTLPPFSSFLVHSAVFSSYFRLASYLAEMSANISN